MCDEITEEILAISLAENRGLNWNDLTYDQRESFRLSACSLIAH